MKKGHLIGNLMLLLAAFIWGIAFVAQTTAADQVPPFVFNGIRSLIGCAVLIPVAALLAGRRGERFIPAGKQEKKDWVIAGVLCGVLLCIAINFQQFGIVLYPDGVAVSGRSGFLTALYVVLVPVFGIFMHKKLSPFIWGSVLLALGGMYLLCMSNGLSGIYAGDGILLCCAVAFTLQILAVDRFISRVDGVRLSCLQFLVCGILSLILSAFNEQVDWSSVLQAWLPIVYLGVMSSGIAYTLQIVGQKYTQPAVASLLMSLESVFAALGGWLLLKERLSARELTGCAIMFTAILVAQLPEILTSLKAKKTETGKEDIR